MRIMGENSREKQTICGQCRWSTLSRPFFSLRCRSPSTTLSLFTVPRPHLNACFCYNNISAFRLNLCVWPSVDIRHWPSLPLPPPSVRVEPLDHCGLERACAWSKKNNIKNGAIKKLPKVCSHIRTHTHPEAHAARLCKTEFDTYEESIAQVFRIIFCYSRGCEMVSYSQR